MAVPQATYNLPPVGHMFGEMDPGAMGLEDGMRMVESGGLNAPMTRVKMEGRWEDGY